MLDNFLRKKEKLIWPMILNQKNATLEDLALHMNLRQRLKESTIEKTIRYARFMQKHKIPIDFNNLNYTRFIRHMDYRERVEHATAEALRHECWL